MNIIAFIVILLIVGAVSMSFGINEPKYVLMTLLIVTALFEYGLGIIEVDRFDVTWLIGILVAIVFIREANR